MKNHTRPQPQWQTFEITPHGFKLLPNRAENKKPPNTTRVLCIEILSAASSKPRKPS
jgi:hypothetical protein